MAIVQDRSRHAQRLASDPGPNIVRPLSRVDTVGTTRSAGDVKALTPLQYANAVSEHARQTTVSSPFPGYNFENLATFLCRSFDYRQSARTPSMPRKGEAAAQLFPFLSIYRLNASGSIEGPSVHDDPSTLLPSSDKQSSSILFLRGKPSSTWLPTIGAYYKVDPEFFNRHLDFLSTVGRIDYFSSPSFPSAQPMLIQVPYITIGQIENATRQANQFGIDGMRLECAKKMVDFRKAVQQRFDCDHGTGESLVRGFYLHDDLHFALEQRISIALTKVSGSWRLIVWLDTGKPLAEGPDGPWQSLVADTRHALRGRTSLRVYPNIQTKPSVALRSHLHRIDTSGIERRTHDNLAQSASLLATDYGRFLDAATMAADPFFALHDIFTFVAFSYRQYLNMLEQKNTKRTRLALGPESGRQKHSNPSQWDSTNILYDRTVVEDHITHLRYLIDIARNRGFAAGMLSPNHSWPRSSDLQQEQRAADAARLLLKYFEDLESQAERLLVSYREGMSVLMSRAMVAEANKNLEQAKEVAKLTKLAFVYIPLSFTASFFGMNLSPINGSINNGIELWVWFAVSAPVLIVSLVLMTWDVRDMWEWCKGGVTKLWKFFASDYVRGDQSRNATVIDTDEVIAP